MIQYFTLPNVLSVLALATIVFGVFNYFKDPQISGEKKDIRTDGQLALLRQELVNLKDNHIHTLEKNSEAHSRAIADLSLQVAKLVTVIEERVPRK